MKLATITILAAVLLLAGCTQQGGSQASGETSAKTACIQLCQAMKTAGGDLSNGPCLSNEIAPDWVCDVAHSPRAAADDNPANQCPEYGASANHFVEVDKNCNVIQTY